MLPLILRDKERCATLSCFCAESKKSEVLDFVEYLRTKTDDKKWSAFTLASAMRGMEDEDSLYTLDDLKESSS